MCFSVPHIFSYKIAMCVSVPTFTRITMYICLCRLVDAYNVTTFVCICFPISDFKIAHRLLRNMELRLSHRKSPQNPTSEFPKIRYSYMCIA